MTLEDLPRFVAIRSVSYTERQRFELNTLKLSGLLELNDPIRLVSLSSVSVIDLVEKLIDHKLTLADKSFMYSVMEELAVYLGQDDEANNSPSVRQITAADLRAYSHSGGQSFWHLLSANSRFYAYLHVELGRQARERRRAIRSERSHACNRLIRDFPDRYLTSSFAIDWGKLSEVVTQERP